MRVARVRRGNLVTWSNTSRLQEISVVLGSANECSKHAVCRSDRYQVVRTWDGYFQNQAGEGMDCRLR